MQTPDPILYDIVLRNPHRIQAGYDRMIDGKAIQIEGAHFRLRTRYGMAGESVEATGLVLIGRDERGEWLPCQL